MKAAHEKYRDWQAISTTTISGLLDLIEVERFFALKVAA